MPENIDIYIAYTNDIPESCIVYYVSQHCMYAIYAGLINFSLTGLNNLLYWEAIIDAKRKGIRYFDFVGARVNPKPGSKQEGIQRFKRHFGGDFVKGYLWKLPINKWKYFLYDYLLILLNFLKLTNYKGDIIDQEIRRNEKEKNNSDN